MPPPITFACPRTMMRHRFLICCALAAQVLAGCDTSQSASEANFEAAINAYLVDQPMCLSDRRWTFPASTDRRSGGTLSSADFRTLDPLVTAGLLRREAREVDLGYARFYETEFERQQRERQGIAREAAKDTVQEYHLTPKGTQAYRPQSRQAVTGRYVPVGGEFCYGSPRVAEIVRYTEPAEAYGRTVSEVTFTARVEDIAEWAQHPALSEVFPDLAQALGSRTAPVESRTALVLTNEGWTVP